MKTPPLLLFTALLFWGWQSHMLLVGVIAGALLESARVFHWRWDFEDVDFNRIWSLCVLVVVVLFGYVFTTNDEGGGFRGLFQGPAALHNAQTSSTLATTNVLRWLPLIFFPFVAAQIFNVRPTVPLTSVSLVLRWRRRRGQHPLAEHYADVTHAFFVVCIFSAGIHTNNATHTYFVGQAILILWALWALRRQRFRVRDGVIMAAAALLVAGLGFMGELGIGQIERVVQNFNAQWMARFLRSQTDATQSITSLGHIGELMLSPRIVIRLQPEKPGEAPDYLREATYRTYNAKNQSWYAGSSANDFSGVLPEPDNTTWILMSNQVGTASINIACYLEGRSKDENRDPEGVLPLPPGTSRLLNLPAVTSIIALQTNSLGAVLARGAGLLIFDARYGPGITLGSPPDTSTNQLDLRVPDEETNALAQVIAEMHPAATNDLQLRQAVEAFFAGKFTYSTWQAREKRAAGITPLTAFLLNHRSGHCEYFATATVLLLRQLGIPARYTVGYAVHETSGTGYVVRERDAHAWCLAWDRDKKRWVDFDTTPGSWIAVEGRRGSLRDYISDLRSWMMFQLEKLRWRQSHLRQYILWTLIPVILVLLYYIIFQRRTKTRLRKKTVGEAAQVWPGHDSAFYRLERALSARGLPREPGEALADWLDRAMTEPGLAGLRGQLRELLQLHYRYRFDPFGLSDAEKKRLVDSVDASLKTLGSSRGNEAQTKRI